MTWTLRRDGRALAVEVDPGARRRTVLLVDGEPVATDDVGYWGSTVLEHEDLHVKAEWGPLDQLERVRLLRGDDDGGDETAGLDFVPPPGSRAARREALRRDHPVRFKVQADAVAGLQVVVGVLGIGALLTALVRGLLPRLDVDWSWLPSLPDVDWPGWLRYLDPGYWLAKLPWPDLDLPDLLPSWLTDSARYWVPLLVAALVAWGEVDRRRKQDAERSAGRGDGRPSTEGDPDDDTGEDVPPHEPR